MLRWLDREPVQRWLGTLFLAWLVVLVGPSAIDRATSEPSAWDWVWLGIFGSALAVSVVSTILAWRNRNTVRVPAKVSPAEVALPDVSAAIASSSGRIDAIRRLRQMYPGLGLLDAKELVARQLPGPG
ncbi:hypothetical protein [Prescottella equi]|uniref:hypothetical protein n=1 Tax=Rhodococcus hoagii TaxID=43767 RepID=UPI00131BA12D|nr:hypothetical protein [Prescottella equi]